MTPYSFPEFQEPGNSQALPFRPYNSGFATAGFPGHPRLNQSQDGMCISEVLRVGVAQQGVGP